MHQILVIGTSLGHEKRVSIPWFRLCAYVCCRHVCQEPLVQSHQWEEFKILLVDHGIIVRHVDIHFLSCIFDFLADYRVNKHWIIMTSLTKLDDHHQFFPRSILDVGMFLDVIIRCRHKNTPLIVPMKWCASASAKMNRRGKVGTQDFGAYNVYEPKTSVLITSIHCIHIS